MLPQKKLKHLIRKPQMTIKTKSLGFNIKASSDEAGKFTAYGNTFGNVDHAGDKTMKGAFSKCIQGWNAKARMPRLLSQHGHRQNPIGIITSMKEDENGLLFEGEFCTEPGTAGAEAYALVKMGALDMFSIGYNTIKEKMVSGINELHELDVKEISLVTFACNENSLIQTVKSAIDSGEDVTTRMIQKSLQEAGFSKRQAEAAVNAIKVTGEDEEMQKTAEEIFLSKKESHIVLTDKLTVKADQSMSDYVSLINKAVVASVESDSVYAYTVDLYMDYAILAVYDYSGEDYKEFYVKVPFSMSGPDNVLVGDSYEVTKDVSWLTADDIAQRTAAGVKSTDPEVIEAPADVTEEVKGENILDELKSLDFSELFK